MTRYIVGFLLAVGLIVVVIVLIVRGLTSSPSTSPSTALKLTDYAGTATVMRLTLDSPTAAPDTHHDIIITVGNDQTTLQVTKGYDGDIVRQKIYPMTTNAYAVFLRSLALNGFTTGDNNPKAKDERGQCALGDRYIYEVVDGSGNDLQRYWYTSCGSGTFQGSVSPIYKLFILQVPDYYRLTNDIHL